MSENNTTALTPYAAAKLVNAELEKVGVAKRIPPQMMYNYTKQRLNAGKKPLIGFDEKKGVDRKSLEEWTKAYIAKQVAAETPAATEETVEA